MRLTTFLIFLSAIILTCTEKEIKLQELALPKEGVFLNVDSIKFTLDSLTTPKSENIYLEDSILYICNPEASLISKINITTGQKALINLNTELLSRGSHFSAIYIRKGVIYGVQKKIKKRVLI